jgi:hypothetical protein
MGNLAHSICDLAHPLSDKIHRMGDCLEAAFSV